MNKTAYHFQSVFQTIAVSALLACLTGCGGDRFYRSWQREVGFQVNSFSKTQTFRSAERVNVVFVIDNSTSMDPFQKLLSTSISKMVETLPTNAIVDFSVYSTGEFLDNGQAVGTYFPSIELTPSISWHPYADYGPGFDLFTGKTVNNSPYGILTYHSPGSTVVTDRIGKKGLSVPVIDSYTKPDGTTWNGLAADGYPIVNYSWKVGNSLFPSTDGKVHVRAGDSAAAYAASKTALTQGLQLGSNGSSIEQGLCNLLRLSNADDSLNPFPKNESSIVVMVTDTDPTSPSPLDNCAKGISMATFKTPDTTMDFRFNAKQTFFTTNTGFELLTGDGTQWRTTPPGTFGINTQASGCLNGYNPLCNSPATENQSFTCTADQVAYVAGILNAHYGVGKWRGLGGNATFGCQSTFKTGSYFMGYSASTGYQSYLLSAADNTLNCNSDIPFRGTIYHGAYAAIQVLYPHDIFDTACTPVVHADYYRGMLTENSYPGLNQTSTSEDIAGAVSTQLENRAGGKSVSFFGISNDYDLNPRPGITPGEAPSTSVRQLASKFGRAGHNFSIYAPDFGAVSDAIRQNISYKPDMVYALTNVPSIIIHTKVTLTHSDGTTSELAISRYAITTNQIQFLNESDLSDVASISVTFD